MLSTLPKKRKAPKMGTRKSPWYRSAPYLAYVRSHECAVAGRLDECSGPIVAAHVRLGTDGCWTEKPSDWWTIPLCDHHHRIHHKGEQSFERDYGIDGREVGMGLWRHPNNAARRRKWEEQER